MGRPRLDRGRPSPKRGSSNIFSSSYSMPRVNSTSPPIKKSRSSSPMPAAILKALVQQSPPNDHKQLHELESVYTAEPLFQNTEPIMPLNYSL